MARGLLRYPRPSPHRSFAPSPPSRPAAPQARCAPLPTQPGLARVAHMRPQVGQARLAVGRGWGWGWRGQGTAVAKRTPTPPPPTAGPPSAKTSPPPPHPAPPRHRAQRQPLRTAARRLRRAHRRVAHRMIPKSCRLFGQDHAPEPRRARERLPRRDRAHPLGRMQMMWGALPPCAPPPRSAPRSGTSTRRSTGGQKGRLLG